MACALGPAVTLGAVRLAHALARRDRASCCELAGAPSLWSLCLCHSGIQLWRSRIVCMPRGCRTEFNCAPSAIGQYWWAHMRPAGNDHNSAVSRQAASRAVTDPARGGRDGLRHSQLAARLAGMHCHVPALGSSSQRLRLSLNVTWFGLARVERSQLSFWFSQNAAVGWQLCGQRAQNRPACFPTLLALRKKTHRLTNGPNSALDLLAGVAPCAGLAAVAVSGRYNAWHTAGKAANSHVQPWKQLQDLQGHMHAGSSHQTAAAAACTGPGAGGGLASSWAGASGCRHHSFAAGDGTV